MSIEYYKKNKLVGVQMLFHFMTAWLAMTASSIAFFSLYGSLRAKSFGEVVMPMLSTTLMSGFAYLMWTS